MTSRSIPSAFVKSVLQNGVGRYVGQLQRLTLKFCKKGNTSRGARDFIENHVIDFTRKNPGTVLYVQPVKAERPKLVAEYLNGNTEVIDVYGFPQDEICKWVEHLRTRSGFKIVRLRKKWHTENPSIQGVWDPFTNKDTALNVTQFPDTTTGHCPTIDNSATSTLLERAKKLRLKSES